MITTRIQIERYTDWKTDRYAKTKCSLAVIDHYSLATDHYSQHAWIASRQIKTVQIDTNSSDRYRQMFKSYYCLLACVKRDLIDSGDLKDSQTDADRLLLISTNFHTTDRLTWVKFTYFTTVHFTYKRDGLQRQKTSF